MPTTPRSRAACVVSTPVPSTRSVKEPESISSVDQVVELALEPGQMRPQLARGARRSRSRLTPPSATVPRSSRVPNSRSYSRTSRSRSICARLAGTVNATSVAMRADVGDVVVDPFQLEQHHAQARGARRHVDAGQALDGVGVGQRVPHRRVARRSTRPGTGRGARAGARSASRCPCERRRAGAAGTAPARPPRQSGSARAR